MHEPSTLNPGISGAPKTAPTCGSTKFTKFGWVSGLLKLSMVAVSTAVLWIACAPPRTAPPPGPAITLERELWDFGAIERGERVSTRIQLTNRGDDSLRVSLYTSCECLTAGIAREVIPPGGATLLSLSLLGDEVREVTSKTLFVDSNDPIRPRAAITARGRVTEGEGPHLVVTPNPLPVEPASQGRLVISNRGKQELVIRDVRCFGCSGDWTQTVVGAGEEAVLQVELLPDWPDQRWIELDSNDPVSPLRKVSLVETR